MDRNPFKTPQNKSPKQRGFKNVGFIAIIVLLGLIIIAAYNRPSTLQTIPFSQVIQDSNKGDYSTIVVNGTNLQITKKGDSKATQQSYMAVNTDLKTNGLELNKVSLSYKPQSSTGSTLATIGIDILPIIIISGLLFFMLRSAQGQGNQAMSFGKSKARLYGNEKERISFSDRKSVV